MILVLLLVFIAECWMTAGHILMKKEADHAQSSSLSGWAWVAGLASRGRVWAGLVLMLIGFLFWYRALAVGTLSVVYALGSIQHVLALFAASWFLGERIDRMKLLGTLLITAGIALIAVQGVR